MTACKPYSQAQPTCIHSGLARQKNVAFRTLAAEQEHSRLEFVEFVVERQALMERRRSGLPPDEWTSDQVLRRGKFCCIDRRDDFVTRELAAAVAARPEWCQERMLLLCATLRFTSSRRGEVKKIAALIDEGWDAGARCLPLQQALRCSAIRCGVAYQMCLNRGQVASRLCALATSVTGHVETKGGFGSVAEAADFIATEMTVDKKRPQFSSNETAKDLNYFGFVSAEGGGACHLEPGARKGLAIVRARMGPEQGREGPWKRARGEARAGRQSVGAVGSDLTWALRSELRGAPGLGWVSRIDVEQALCEYMKYVTYCEEGISAGKMYALSGSGELRERLELPEGRKEGASASASLDVGTCGGRPSACQKRVLGVSLRGVGGELV